MQASETTGEQPGLRSIGEVVELLQREHPSITASSLRFLERIGLVKPARTSGGHRLYRSEDIARIRTIKRLQDERFTLDEIADRLAAAPAGTAIDPEEFLFRALAGDAPGAARLAGATIESGLSAEELFSEVLAPALVEVGDRWAAGDITVAQEKAASEVIRDLVAIAGVTEETPLEDAPVLLAAAVPGERHIIGLQMVSALLRLRGYVVHFLGADVDIDFLVDAVHRTQPKMVLLTATMDERFDAVTSAIAAVQAANAAAVVVVGGQITQGRADELEALGALVVGEQEPGAAVSDVQRLQAAILV